MPLRCFFYSAAKMFQDGYVSTRVEGLILEPTQNAAGEFRRLGVFNFYRYETALLFLRTEDSGLQYEKGVDSIEYVFFDKSTNKEVKWTAKQHIIKII